MWKRFVRFGFRLLYNELAWMYDLVAWLVSFGRWKMWGRTALKYVQGQRVLELAHGPGHLLIALKRAGYDTIGIDLSASMSKQAARRLRRADIVVPLVVCRAQALPFRAGSFDSVISTFPTDYMYDPATLHEVVRVTSGRGRWVIVAAARLAGRTPHERLVEWLYRITGQRDSMEDEASIFDALGMPLRIESERIGRSEVTLLIADKVQAA